MKSYFHAVNYACVSAQPTSLKAQDVHTACIYHPDRNSTATKSHRQCYNKQWQTIGNERSSGQRQPNVLSTSSTNCPNQSVQKTEKGFIKQHHAPSPPDFLCHPGLPDGEKKDRRSIHHCQKADRRHVKLSTWDRIGDTYRMAAGTYDAGGSQHSFHTLENEG